MVAEPRVGRLRGIGRRRNGMFDRRPGFVHACRMPTDQLEFGRFHEDELPRRLAAGHGALARDLAARLGPLTVGLPDGRAYTYVATDDSIEIRPGDEKTATKIELDPEVWLNLVPRWLNGSVLTFGQLFHTLSPCCPPP